MAVAGVCSFALGQIRDGRDPVPIQRILIPPDRVAKELEKVQQGALIMMPRAEFEARLGRALQAVKAREQKPHLTRAHYSAELVDRAFTNGSGQWTIVHNGAAAAIMPINTLNLALAKLKWEQGGDAILAEFDGKTLGLLVHHADSATCLFDWSARGTPTNESIAFNLAVPACPVTTFELILPSDYWLAAPKDTAVVTGPHDAASPRKRLWKMQVTGSKPIDLVVRKITAAKDPAPTLFARIHSTQKLNPERLDVEHEFQVDVPHGSIRELILEGDPGLQPYQVVLANGEVLNWRWKEIPGKKEGKPSGAASGLMTIQFEQPLRSLQGLRVRSLMARHSSNLWTSPALRVRDAIPRGETLEVHLHPDVTFGKWDSGSFRPIQISTQSDGTQILTLAQSAESAASSRPPMLMAPTWGIDLHTSENYRWHITPRGATLTAEIHYEPALGNLFELKLKLPKTSLAYQIESLELQPADVLGSWHTVGDMLVVELKHALTAMKKAALKIQLRCSFPQITTATDLHFPELEPIGAPKREGTLTIQVDSTIRAELVSHLAPLAPAGDVDRDPDKVGVGWDGFENRPTYRFKFRDQRLGAIVRLVPQIIQAEITGKHTISLSEQGAALRFRWDIQPLAATPEFLDFRFAPGFSSSWKVRQEDGDLRFHHWERLYLHEALPHLLQLGSPQAIPVAALESLLPSGSYWRFHLSEPLRKKSSFTLEASSPAGKSLPKPAGNKTWSLPLMTPVQHRNVIEEFELESPSEPIGKVVVDGTLRPGLQGPQSEKALTQVRLQHAGGPFEPATRIELWTRPEKRSTSQLELCDEARLTTYVHKDGRIYYRIQFRLWHWHDRTCEIQLPRDFQVLEVKLHDRWLQRIDFADSPKGVRLTLPFDQNVEYVRYEILARCEPAGCYVPGLRKIHVPQIEWPIAPIDLRTRYFLQAGVRPLHSEMFCQLGVPDRIARQSETPRLLRRIWNWGQSWWPYGEQAALSEKMENQKQAVLREAANLRGGANKTMKLSEALERFALDHLKDQAPLVIDKVALCWLGLSGDTVFSSSGRPFWETLGLIYVPCPSGALLTSPRRMQSLGINSALEATELDEAIQEAILHGQDASSGFFLVLTWLNLPSAAGQALASEGRIAASDCLGDFQEMSEWDMGADGMGLDGFDIVEPPVARSLGWLLAILAALLLGSLQRALAPLPCFRAYILIVTVSMLVVFWSSLQVREFYVLPTFLVELAFLAWCIVRVILGGSESTGGNSTLTRPAATAAASGLLLLGAALSVVEPGASWANAPAPRTHAVLVIEGAKPAVLLTPELIAKLDELENHAGPGAVLVSAKYAGKIKDSHVNFDVQYEIHSLKDKTNLVIPLTGVQLNEGAFLDGAPVFPAPHKNGYTLPMQGKGQHNLQLTFSVRTSCENEQIDLRFTVPKLIQNEITLQWPTPVQAIHCLHSCGEEKTPTDPRQPAKQWHAQLGYESVVHLRWNNAVAVPSPNAIAVREAHFWDLRPAALTLISSLKYSIGKGSLAQLVVAVPERLQVRAVEALAISAVAPATPIAIKHWHLLGQGDQRRLVVEFVQSVTGQLTLNLTIVPRSFAQETKLLLPLPAALQGESVFGLLGYRLDAEETGRAAPNLVAVLNVSADQFQQQWKKQNAPTLPPGPTLTRAYTFQRKAAKAWLELRTQPHDWKAQGQIQWNVNHAFADVQGKFTITSSRENLIFLEFFVDPSMTLADVTGPDVRRWYLHESILQVWLRQPRKETSIKLSGWRSHFAKVGSAKNGAFALPCIYPLDTQLAAVTLEVRPESSIHLELERSSRLRPNGAGKLNFTVDEAAYQATFRMTAETKSPSGTMLTKVRGSEQGMEIWHAIHMTTRRGQLPNVKLHVKDWTLDGLLLDAPGALVQPIRGPATKHQAWTLKYASGLPQEVLIILRGRVAKDMHASISLPVVELEGATIRRHWLAWKDVEIQHAASGKTLSHERSVKDAIAPSDGGSWLPDLRSWNFAQAVGPFKVVLPKISAGPSARVLASTENARLSGKSRRLHEAGYWIHAPKATQLRIQFPAPVQAISVWTDRQLRPALRSTPQEYVLPLDAKAEPRLVELRWQYTDNVERAETPSIAAVQLDQMPLLAHHRVVWVPHGMFVAPPSPRPLPPAATRQGQGAPTLLRRLLHEAESEMDIAAALAREPSRSLDIKKLILIHQQNFYVCARRAEYALAILKNEPTQIDQASALAQLNELKRKNSELAKHHNYLEQQKSAKKGTPRTQVLAPESDFVLGATPLMLPPNLPSLSLQHTQALSLAQQRTHSELFVLVAVFLLVFSYFRHGWSIVRLVGPELTIALTTAAMFVYGLSLIGLFLIVAMVFVRSLRITSALKKRFAYAAPEIVEAKPPSNKRSG
jgi:hypothetical protein